MTVTTEPTISRFGPSRLFRDAASLASSSVVNAVLGMVFWATAGFMVPPDRLGVMTAVLAVLTAPALVVATGVGDAYTSLLPAVGEHRPLLYARGQRAVAGLSIGAGLVAAGAAITMLDDVRGSVSVAVLIAAGTVVWAFFTLQNITLTSLGRARWLPYASGAASVGKVVLLPILAVAVWWHFVELAVLLSAVAVVLVLRPSINRIVAGSIGLPSHTSMTKVEARQEFDRFAKRTLASAALTLGVLALTPFLVTAFAGPSEGALFALSLAIVQTLDFVGSAMGVSLVVHASSNPRDALTMARSILVKAGAICACGALAVVVAAPIVIGTLDSRYDERTVLIVVAALSAGSVIRTVYMVWAALQRARRRMSALLTLNGLCGIVLLTSIPLLCSSFGAIGGALALLGAQVVLSVGAVVDFLLERRRLTAAGAVAG